MPSDQADQRDSRQNYGKRQSHGRSSPYGKHDRRQERDREVVLTAIFLIYYKGELGMVIGYRIQIDTKIKSLKVAR